MDTEAKSCGKAKSHDEETNIYYIFYFPFY